jgi:hypothetical protein
MSRLIGKRTKVSNFGIIWEKRQTRLAAILGRARAGSLAPFAKGSPLNNPNEITFSQQMLLTCPDPLAMVPPLSV